MNSILQKIAKHKIMEVEWAKKNRPEADFKAHFDAPVRDFVQALAQKAPAVIAEIKKASPSKGVIRENFDVASIASTYEQHGACCLSVLTDEHFFQGNPQNLMIARQHSVLPVLRKDFIVNRYQIPESRFLGADCILLIAALLDDHQLLDFCEEAQALHMAVLVESHTREEFERALKLPTPLMGINNRSLHTFKTDLQISIQIKKDMPKDKILISESGIDSHDDILLMQNHGIQCFLIGESLMKAPDIGKKLTELILGK